MLHAAFHLGFRSFDVAPCYGNGLNEVELGLAFAMRASDVRITTKFGIPADLYGERHRMLFPALRLARKIFTGNFNEEYGRRHFSPQEMVESLNGSLRRLRIQAVDRLLIHEPLATIGASLSADLFEQADKLKSEGKIRSFGICGPGNSVGLLSDQRNIDVVQMPLCDVLSSASFDKHVTAYGVFREFKRNSRDVSFASFVSSMSRRHAHLEFILSTTSMSTLSKFAPVFS